MSTCGAQPAVTKLTYQLLSFFVLNYSAITASCVQPGLYDSVDVMCKDLQGNCVVMNSATRTTLRTQSHDLPMKRIAQLFNVNHFIVSQVVIVHMWSLLHTFPVSHAFDSSLQINPHVVAAVRSTKSSSRFSLAHRFAMGLGRELHHRISQLLEFVSLPRCVPVSLPACRNGNH